MRPQEGRDEALMRGVSSTRTTVGVTERERGFEDGSASPRSGCRMRTVACAVACVSARYGFEHACPFRDSYDRSSR